MNKSVLISDFDGTITDDEFYALIRAQYMPPGTRDAWQEYLRGEICHFDAMAGVFANAPAESAALERLLAQMKPDPELGAGVRRLREAGWDLIVASAGSAWYIQRILQAAGVDVPVHANPGHIEAGGGLVLERPYGSPFYSQEIGIDKAAVVRDAVSRYERAAFAGDGPLDFDAAVLVPAEYRFARGMLAQVMNERGTAYRRFGRWSEIVDALSHDGNSAGNGPAAHERR